MRCRCGRRLWGCRSICMKSKLTTKHIVKPMKHFALLCLVLLSQGAQCNETTERISFGFTEAAPNGASVGGSFSAGETKSWSYTRTRSGIEAINRPAKTSTEFQVEAYLIRVDQSFESTQKYLDMMLKNLELGYAQSTKWQKVRIALTPEVDKPRCVRGELLLREKTTVSDEDAMFSEQHFLSCPLEKRAPFGVEVRYYHRYKGNARDNAFTQRAKSLLDSVELNDR